MLLESNNIDSRVIGLKLLARHPLPTDDEIVAAILTALRRQDGYESTGGIHELTMFLDHRYPDGALPPQHLIQPLSAALQPLYSDDTYPGLAQFAADQLRRVSNYE